MSEHYTDSEEMCIIYMPVPCSRRIFTKMIRVSKEEYFLVPENCRTMEGGCFSTAKYYVFEHILRKIQMNNSLSEIIEQKTKKIRRRM